MNDEIRDWKADIRNSHSSYFQTVLNRNTRPTPILIPSEKGQAVLRGLSPDSVQDLKPKDCDWGLWNHELELVLYTQQTVRRDALALLQAKGVKTSGWIKAIVQALDEAIVEMQGTLPDEICAQFNSIAETLRTTDTDVVPLKHVKLVLQ